MLLPNAVPTGPGSTNEILGKKGEKCVSGSFELSDPQAGAYPGFCAMKRLSILLLSMGVLVH